MMLINLLAVASIMAGMVQETDTIVPVDPDARLQINNLGGEVRIEGWDRSEMRIQAEHSRRTLIVIRGSSSVVRVGARSRHGPANVVDYYITVPRSMSVHVNGTYTDIEVTGIDGEVWAKTMQGNVAVTGGSGSITLHSVQGTVTLEGASGRAELESVSEDIRVTDVSGPMVIESVSGDIILERISSADVEAGTVSGDVVYDGTLEEGGQYLFLTHSGDVGVSVPEGADATLVVATLNGSVRATFDLPARESGSRRRRVFTLAGGSASVEIESFSGDVRFFRPGERRRRR